MNKKGMEWWIVAAIIALLILLVTLGMIWALRGTSNSVFGILG